MHKEKLIVIKFFISDAQVAIVNEFFSTIMKENISELFATKCEIQIL